MNDTDRITPLGAWALAFGCAIGWDAFVLPWTNFLPKAGPLGTALGILAGGIVMAVVAWNYHFMLNSDHRPGGAYAYASDAFGSDHGFLCAWFLCLVYVSIIWLDAAALVIVARFAFGDVLQFGFGYSIAGHETCLGHILLSVAAIAAASAVCCRRALACRMQLLFAVVLAAGIVACFWAAFAGHGGGFAAMKPAFVPDGGTPTWQVLQVVAVAPWLFVGFESISQSSVEFGFSMKRAFWIMAAAIGAAVAGYALLAAIPALAPDAAGWTGAVSRQGPYELQAFAAAARCFGGTGVAIVFAVLAGAVFTNLIGNMFAASRLLATMADDGVMPKWVAKRGRDGSPRNAVFAIFCVSLLVAPLGQAVIGVIVDTALVGAAVAYAYTSAAAYRTAKASGKKASAVSGLCGLVLSVAIILLFVFPDFDTDAPPLMSTGSYFVVVVWCIAGLVSFLTLFRNDRRRRFGRSTVVWLSLLGVILLMSLMWLRQTTYDTTQKAFDDIARHHAEMCEEDGHGNHPQQPDDWQEILRGKLAYVNRSIVRNSLVQGAMILLSLSLMFCIYAILRNRERAMEREKTRAKSYFFSTVSHDIRTPLNAIIGFSELLKAGPATEAEREQAIDSILVSGKTLLGLINDVLELSKLESGKMKIAPEPTDCRLLLRELIDMFRISGGKPGLELRCRADDMPPLMIDPQRLRQIVFNLVGNAVKFTQRGYVELRARYRRADGAPDGVFRLEVEDTGCGISDEDKAHIGSAYVQVGSRLSRNGGTGLGLAICSQLASAMGGKLGVVSKLGSGSTFSVTIPGVAPAPAPVPPSASAPGKEREPDGPHPKRILLVDDSKMNLMVLKALLKGIGDFEMSTAADGQEALSMLEAPAAEPFDLVLTDMWMPNMDGAGLVKAIRGNPALASMRVVVVTADVEMQGKSAAAGFDDMLLKPVTKDSLTRLFPGEAAA